MKTTKKILSILLAVLLLTTTMALCAVPTSALPVTGSCGTDLTYTYNTSTGAVTISGTGSSISSEAFKMHPEINSVSICNSVKTIGSEAFFRCTNLESVSFPSGLERINYQAFYACNKLKSANIPATVTTIGEGAFEGCWALTVFSIPDGVAAIAKEAFAHCDHLKTVIIPASVTSIGILAFDGCSLTDVYFKGTESQWNNITIGSYNDSLNNATKHFNTSSDTRLVQINVSASPTSAGTVSGGGAYLTGESVTITATPNAGYKFTGWYYRNNKVSSNATYTFTAATDGNLKAEFDPLPSYTVSASASPSAGGTVTGGGTYTEGATATVKATANSGYIFDGWYQGSTLKSSSANYSFTVTGGVSLTAKFQKAYTVSVSASPTAGGTVTGGGTYVEGTAATLTATANEGWEFVRWVRANGTGASVNATFDYTVTENTTLRAVFMPVVKLYAAPAAAGSVSGGGAKTPGKIVTVTATPKQSQYFVGWFDVSSGERVSREASYSFEMPEGPVELLARFANSPYYDIAAAASPAEGGTATGGGYIVSGRNANMTATPNEGWHFVGWFDGETKVSDDANFAYRVTNKDVTLTAQFEKDAAPDNPNQPGQPDNPGGGNDQPTNTNPDNGGQSQGKVCKYCGEVHKGFPGVLIGFFHSILALFGLRKK